MKPGPFPWASNDVWAAGPDIGSETKLDPAALAGDGYYRSRRPSPRVLNWQLNRAALSQRLLAQMMARNLTFQSFAAIGGGISIADVIHQPRGVTDGVGNTLRNPVICVYNSGAGANVFEQAFPDGVYMTTPPSSVIHAAVAAPAKISMASNGSGAANPSRVCVIDENTAPLDWVYNATNFAAGSWGLAGGAGFAWAAGAPGLRWREVGCDRSTGSTGNEIYLIGDDGGGGNPVVYSSTNGGAWTANGTFPALGAVAVREIIHSCHPAGAMAPAGAGSGQDPGNPLWMVFTSGNNVTVSADLATWNTYAVGTTPNSNNQVCYSRTAQRWFVCDVGTAGRIRYSDDNGATWNITDLTPTPPAVGTPRISCDGYGTIVFTDGATQYWVSSDDGDNWSNFIGYTIDQLTFAFDEGSNAIDVPPFSSFFFGLEISGTPTIDGVKSLAY